MTLGEPESQAESFALGDTRVIRFVCEMAGDEQIIEADTPEDAARQAAEKQAARDGAGRYTVNVAEANEADLPLIAGNDYVVTMP